MEHPVLTLKKGKTASLERKHPWIFSGALASIPDIEEGIHVIVQDHKGAFCCMGQFHSGSIAVRILSYVHEEPNQQFWNRKLQQAYKVREEANLTKDTETNTYRLVFGEGDELPGLIIDWYDGVAVIQAHTIGMFAIRDELTTALKNLYGEKLKAVYDKSSETLKTKARTLLQNEYLFGTCDIPYIVSENGAKFLVDWESGQKTGFFLDQRENRAILGQYARDKTVLNTFSYTGGFSIYALQAGAKFADSVDSSARAIKIAIDNAKLNGFENHNGITSDAYAYIREKGSDYDLIILDPPAFAKSVRKRHNALMGYKRLNAMAIKQIKPGGIIFTFSCSQVVDTALFTKTIIAAAIDAGRKVRILQRLSQPADHPVNAFHPEGHYLKGLVLYVD